ncbi:glycosyltransferase family 9 protein [Humibacter ginsengisoli]
MAISCAGAPDVRADAVTDRLDIARNRFPDIHRIAVLRAGGLGDFLFALPALHALREAYPASEITVLGTPMHAELMRDRPGPPDRVIPVPPSEGVRPGAIDARETDAFFTRMRACGFDLAVQLHGGGRNSNPFVQLLGARHTIGTRTPDAAPLERTIPYLYYQNEFVRGLEVAALAGAVPSRFGCEPVLARVPGASGAEVLARFGIAPRGPLVVGHPGATDPRRRWPAKMFARVAAELAAQGCTVVVVGDEGERALCDAVATAGSRAASRVASVAGRLDLGDLAAVLGDANVVIANDSGPRHLAHALGTATVAVYWIGNLINAGPLTRARHRVHLGWTARCPVCGADCTGMNPEAARCEHDESFVADVPWRDVYDSALQLLELG